MSRKLSLYGGPPWGFRIGGGADVDQNLVVTRVTPGSPASKAGLRSRDILLAINGNLLKNSTRSEAEALIRTSSEKLDLILKLATAWDGKPGRMPAADPTWAVLAKQLEAPRPVGQSGAEGSLVTQGVTFEAAKPLPTVAPPEQNILETRKFLPKTAGRIVCNYCTQDIEGEYSTIKDLNFHKSCFICAAPNCQGSLDAGFLVDGGKAYCVSCHDKYFSEPCAKCGRPILGEVFRAFNCKWHLECFTCKACGIPIYDGVFHMEKGEIYCDSDHLRLFAVTCCACNALIGPGDNEISAIGQKWHDRCFNCQNCRRNLNGKRFVRRNNLPICHNCK